MAIGIFPFSADVVDGKILEFPKLFYLECKKVIPLGLQIVKQYNKTQCIVAKKVFQFYYNGQVLGSVQFSSVVQFTQYLNNICNPFCTPALFTINNCNLEVNDCNLTIYNSCPEGYVLTGWGCNINLFGCNLILN